MDEFDKARYVQSLPNKRKVADDENGWSKMEANDEKTHFMWYEKRSEIGTYIWPSGLVEYPIKP